MDSDANAITESGECFVDRVINSLEYHVMKTCSIIGIPNVHSWTLTDGFKSLKDLNTA